ncbi:MAG: AtpZ/AtpI family protein [Spirosomaceae bacterium]|jgi:F0F1-type ATP synthase assembly protein I|nr:AtpZ/AtpI family protein [Spirosomataceae bacterium]
MDEQDKLKNEVKKAQNWVVYSQIGIQMAATIGLGTWLGYWLDGKFEKFENKVPAMTIILSLLSIGVSMYNVIRQLPKE